MPISQKADLDFHKLDATLEEARQKAPRSDSQGFFYLQSEIVALHGSLDVLAIASLPDVLRAVARSLDPLASWLQDDLVPSALVFV